MRLVLALGFLALGCAAPKDLAVDRDADGVPVIHWKNSAMGLFVTTPGAKLPGGPDDKVQNGHVYWALEATTFPSGFDGPVTYGVVPGGAKDATSKQGGLDGGEMVMPGVTYQFGVVTLGGQLAVEQTW